MKNWKFITRLLAIFVFLFTNQASARFLAVDPVRAVNQNGNINPEILTNPQRLNLYTYGLNNPYVYVDSDGNSPISVLAKQVAKQGIRQGLKKMGNRQARRLGNYMSQGQRKEFLSDVADVMGSLDSSPLEIAIELVPVAGDIYGGAKFGKQVANAYGKMQDLENKWAEKIYKSLPPGQRQKFVTAMRNGGVRDSKQDAGLPRTGSGLHGHHRNPVKGNPSQMSDPRNIQLLSPSQHRKIHSGR